MAADSRPDPDALLARLQAQEAGRQRGRLRIYFGANAGVGKTYAMLSAAQNESAAGHDVVVGVVETHGRKETAQLLDGLEQLPQRQLPYRGKTVSEFDLDGALARKPAVLLVDELAHSNAPGSRHPKRWQDVQELLDAGIDVWSALNVQHLESLNGTVGAITGVRVHETVPDTVLEGADEIILVDVTPDEMLGRLKAGKVYLPQQAERASQNFFRKGNLIALREMALRRTAEHVEDDVRSWRVEQSADAAASTPVWRTGGAILACIGPQPGAEQTVRSAARLAGQMSVRWYAAYVETPGLARLDRTERDRILAVLKLAQELGADTAVLSGNDVAVEAVRHAQMLNCATLVVGRPTAQPAWKIFRGPSFTRRIATLAPALDVVEVAVAQSTRRMGAPLMRTEGDDDATPGWKAWSRYSLAAASSLVVTAVATPLIGFFDLANIVMLYLLAVALVAVRLGRGPAVVAALVNVAAFDFFLCRPGFPSRSAMSSTC